jgi:hypothetical protein
MSFADDGHSDPAACPTVRCRSTRSPRTAAPQPYPSNRRRVEGRTSPLSEAGATFRPDVSTILCRQEEP